MNFVDKFLRMLKRGISKWIKMPKKKKLSEEDKKVLGRIYEGYTEDAIFEYLGLSSETKRIQRETLSYLRKCHERYRSAQLAKKYPYDPNFESNENCLKCMCKIDSPIECDIKNILKSVEREAVSKLLDEQIELRAICRKRCHSAQIRKEHPIDHRYEKWEKCLECLGDMEFDVKLRLNL